MTPQSVQLSDLARTCWGTFPTKDARLSIETEQAVTADRDQLQQLVSNLFQNAIKHGGTGVTVSIGDTDSGFYIADDGDGLPNSGDTNVFEPGYTTADDGTGFGLGIVKEVVDGMTGKSLQQTALTEVIVSKSKLCNYFKEIPCRSTTK
ncbi:sensor histidine kinase [Halorussus marinus]|uniref:sensor histidine kinase n=1 Tax=Halorussus marinus TaxID=2505976 RepID=UPI001ADB8C02|nr:ATP-binding protein [Halorussus marinus]